MAQPAADPLGYLTDRARTAVVQARAQVQRLGHEQIGPEHVLLAMVDAEESVAVMVLASLGVSSRAVRMAVEQRLPVGQPFVAIELVMSQETERVLERAHLDAARVGCAYVRTDHLLAAVGHIDSAARDVLMSLGVTSELVDTEASRLLSTSIEGSAQSVREPTADQLIGARRLVVPTTLREYHVRIAEARQLKEAAVDRRDFEVAAQTRDLEQQLLAERQQLAQAWVAEVDPVLLADELDRLHRETEHLRGRFLS